MEEICLKKKQTVHIRPEKRHFFNKFASYENRRASNRQLFCVKKAFMVVVVFFFNNYARARKTSAGNSLHYCFASRDNIVHISCKAGVHVNLNEI